MKVVVEIPDDELSFGLKVLKSLSFVKKAKPLSASAVDLFKNLKEAAVEVKQHKRGKLKLKTAKDLLNEL